MHSHFALLCNKRGRLLYAPITLFYGRQNGRCEVKLGKLVDLCWPSKIPKTSIGRREHILGLQILLNSNKEVLICSDKDLFVLCTSVRGNDLPDKFECPLSVLGVLQTGEWQTCPFAPRSIKFSNSSKYARGPGGQ